MISSLKEAKENRGSLKITGVVVDTTRVYSMKSSKMMTSNVTRGDQNLVIGSNKNVIKRQSSSSS